MATLLAYKLNEKLKEFCYPPVSRTRDFKIIKFNFKIYLISPSLTKLCRYTWIQNIGSYKSTFLAF